MSLTGALALRASSAAVNPCTSGPNLLPNPPPMKCVTHFTLPCGTPNRPASAPAVETVAWVDAQTVSPPSLSHSATRPCVSRHWCEMVGTP